VSGEARPPALSNERDRRSFARARSPLAATLARISALDEYLAAEVGAPRDGDWIRPTELVAADGAPLRAVLARIGGRWQTADRRIHAAFFVNDYVWRLAGATIAAYLSEGRAPDTSAGNVAFRFDAEGSASPPTFLTARFAALVGDDEAQAAKAQVVRDRARLRGWLRQRLETHLELIVASLRALSPLGRRAQWSLAADACASAFLWAGGKLGDEDAAQAEATAFLAAPSSQLRARPSFLTLEHAGGSETFLLRASCCLSYKLPGHQYCATCPLLPEQERVERLRATPAATESARTTG